MDVITALVLMAKNSGFTFIELMIVVFVIGLLSSIGIVSYTEYNARKVTENETHKIVEYLDLGRTKALTADKPDSCPGFTGSYIVSSSGTVVTLTPENCSATASMTLENAITLPEGDFSITFKPQGGGILGDTCILVSHPTQGHCGKISLEASGIVKSEQLKDSSCVCP